MNDRETRLPVRDYNLAATLDCGQAFRWRPAGDAWEGVVGARWVRLRQTETGLRATAAAPVSDWQWLRDYLRLDDDLAAQLAAFPDDAPLRAAVSRWRGLRLLRQEPWECLASFILSSTKQIAQIRQCVAALCARFGEPVEPPGWFAFPSAERIAAAGESELRACKLGFRAKYLRATARRAAGGQLDLGALPRLPLAGARAALMECPGVGRKIADCVLLFALGFDEAFPIDVWVERALRQLYFPRRRIKRARLERFAAAHFGSQAGLAQQYLFHYLRTVHRHAQTRPPA